MILVSPTRTNQSGFRCLLPTNTKSLRVQYNTVSPLCHRVEGSTARKVASHLALSACDASGVDVWWFLLHSRSPNTSRAACVTGRQEPATGGQGKSAGTRTAGRVTPPRGCCEQRCAVRPFLIPTRLPCIPAPLEDSFQEERSPCRADALGSRYINHLLTHHTTIHCLPYLQPLI